MYRRFTLLARAAVAVALCVVVLGAYVRLSDAGLGCPDWPGCYGKLLGVPQTTAEIEQARRLYPRSPLDSAKAWKEVMHRYLAGVLGILIFTLAVLAVINRRCRRQPVALPLLLSVLVVFQALLGMWTVTMLLKPIIVTAHLLGGLATLALLWYLALPAELDFGPDFGPDFGAGGVFAKRKKWLRLVAAGIGLLTVQVALGGWTAGNYAALACPDFPTCQRQWWPPMDFASAFQLTGEPGVNYEHGVLDGPARTAIHVTHRIGALVTLLLLGALLLALLRRTPPPALRIAAVVSLALLVLQTLLGVLNVVLSLPLVVATAHNATAAALLLSLITVARMLKS